MKLDIGLLKFCVSPQQEAALKAVIEHGTKIKAAKHLNVTERSVFRSIERIKTRAALKGYTPGNDVSEHVRDGQIIQGESTMVGPDGEVKLKWVKTSKEQETIEQLQDAFRAAIEDTPRAKKIKAPKGNTDGLAVYPMGDPHIGMYSFYKDTGENFDCDIAERDLLAAMDYLLSVTPPTKTALIINLGDYLHIDGPEHTTTKGTAQDVDTRWSRVLQIGLAILIRLVYRALEKHKNVVVINATGNHDDKSSLFLSVAMLHHFKDNPRVEIRDQQMFHYYEFGKNLIGVHHGHAVKKERLAGVMANDKAEEWGRTKHRYWYTGHIHHRTVTEDDGCLIESFRTLSGKDKWHYDSGYRAGRDMYSIILHPEFGETDRYRCDILRARA